MKSPIEKALDKIQDKNVNIEKMPEPEKPKKGSPEIAVAFDGKPRLYLNDKELSKIASYKAGQKVILVMEGTVESINTYDSIADKKTQKSYTSDIRIDAIADITK
jgi:hypothetical protein